MANGLQESATVQGLSFLIFCNCSEPPAQACLLLSADILSLGAGLSSGCTSAIWQYYPDHPLHVCQGVYSPWKLPAFKPASSLACLNVSSTTELQAVAFCWQNHPSDACEGVRNTYRSTWPVSGMHHHSTQPKFVTHTALGEWSPCCVHCLACLCCKQPPSACSSHGAPGERLPHKPDLHIICPRRSYATGKVRIRLNFCKQGTINYFLSYCSINRWWWINRLLI